MSPSQLHKRLSQTQIETVIENYLSKQVTVEQAAGMLDLKRAQFFNVLKQYRDNPDTFTIQPPVRQGRHVISAEAEARILEELQKEKQMIENPKMTIRTYNYSAVQDILEEKHQVGVSLSTIINRAKEHDFYLPKPEKRIHDREVITHCVGELVRHDSSHHLWSPYMDKELYLVTSLVDHSRMLLFAELF